LPNNSTPVDSSHASHPAQDNQEDATATFLKAASQNSDIGKSAQ